MKSKRILLANSLLLAALLLFILIPTIVDALFNFGGTLSGNVSLLLSGGASITALGGVSLLYCRITKRSFNKVMVIKRISIKQVFLIMFVSVGTYIFAVGVNSITLQLFPIAIEDGMAISNLLSGSSTLLGLIMVVLVPAFFEEIFFRGVLLDAYEGVNKKMKFFILITVFASFHGNVMQIIYVMFLGFILLKVREYTGSLVGSMALHGINNSISFIISKAAMYYMKVLGTGIKNGVIDSTQAPITTDVVSVSFSVALLRASIFFLIGGTILYINLRRLKEYREEKKGLEIIEKEYIARNEEIIAADVKQYIPLAIYFVAMTILVVSKY